MNHFQNVQYQFVEATKWIHHQYFSRIARGRVREIEIEEEKKLNGKIHLLNSSRVVLILSLVRSFVCGTINIRLWTAFWYMILSCVCARSLSLSLTVSNIHLSFYSISLTRSSPIRIVFVSTTKKKEKHLNISLWLFYLYIIWIILFFLSFGKWSLTVFHWDRISKAIFLFFYSFIRSFARSFIFYSF